MMRAGCSPALFPPFVFPALDFNELMHYCARPAPQLQVSEKSNEEPLSGKIILTFASKESHRNEDNKEDVLKDILNNLCLVRV